MLADHLQALDPRGKGASKAADALDFRETAWPGDDKAKATRVPLDVLPPGGEHPPRVGPARGHPPRAGLRGLQPIPPAEGTEGEPTTILLTRSLADYQALVKGRGLKLFNPAFYDPARNEVVCGSDLERMFDELHKVRAHHAELKAKMKERQAELSRRPSRARSRRSSSSRWPTPRSVSSRARIATTRQFAGRSSGCSSGSTTRRSTPTSARSSTRRRTAPLPIWFDEGLAQIFETAIVEVGELRVRPADPDRLAAVRKAIAKGEHPSLADLLRATGKAFQVAHSRDEQVSDAYYRAAWALAVYLTFEKRCWGRRRSTITSRP